MSEQTEVHEDVSALKSEVESQSTGLNNASPDELRRGIADYFRAQEPAPQTVQVPGLPGNLTPQQREAAMDLYEKNLLQKDAGQVSQSERNYLAAKVQEVLRSMGR